MAITKNIVTDYGADNTGVVDIGTALGNLHTDMIGQDADVTFPAGSFNWQSNGSTWINGVLNLNIIATGATTAGNGVFFQTNHVTQAGLDQTLGGYDNLGGKNARIQTVSPGATSVTLTATSAAAGYVSRFSVGQCVLITGWPIQSSFQAPFGFPPNWAFVEHVTITGIVGNTISFTPALQNYYDANWPELNRGNQFQTDAAGPATIVGIYPGWKGTTTVTNGTWDRPDLINGCRESIIYTGANFTNRPAYPTVNKLYRAINCTAASLTEHDKLIDWADIQGGNYQKWECQSGSTRLLTMTGVTMAGLDGTVGDTVLDTCVINGNLSMGPHAYGRANKLTMTNTTLSGTCATGFIETGPTGGIGYVSKAGSVITMPMALNDSITRWSMPDSAGRNVLWWGGASGSMMPFKVLSATADSWPAVDDQTATTNIDVTNGLKTLHTSTAIFSPSDVGKVIIIPNVSSGGNTLRSYITAYSGPQDVTLWDAITGSTLSAQSRSIQWGTCNLYLTTDSTDPIPTGMISIRVPGVRKIRFENCTGTDEIVDLSQAAAWDRPPFSYTKRTYTSVPNTNALPITMHGYIQSIKVNVTKVYSGAQGTLTAGLGQFGCGTYQGSSVVFYDPRINLKVLGERVITIGSTTGAQSGDSGLNLSVPTWIPGTFNSQMSSNISGESSSVWPSYTIEMITDQGFPADATSSAKVRLRMR